MAAAAARSFQRCPLSPFTADTSGCLPGPAWLTARRAAAVGSLDPTALPTPDEEVWRYSRVDELDLDLFAPVAGPLPAEVPAGARAVLDSLPERAGAVVTRNGFVVHTEIDPAVAALGVALGSAASVAGAEHLVGAVASEPLDLFGALNDAFGAEPVVLRVAAGVTVAAPVVVIDWIDEPDAAVFPRLVVHAGENSEVHVLEWQGSDDIVALAAPVTELDAARAARLHYVVVQDRGQRVWQIAAQVSRAGTDATLTASQVALGGDYARTRADCRLVGRGATGNLRAVYFGEGTQMLDFRTFQDHVAPDTTSDLLFKGALDEASRSVYTGLIRVRKGARGTNAFQTNRNLKLSDQAWAESVPNLEIENNDVRCSHASTVGPIDEDQRFYLESRGVPTPIAERLIVAGFFFEVLEKLPVPAVVPLVVDKIDARLDRRTGAIDGGTAFPALPAAVDRTGEPGA